MDTALTGETPLVPSLLDRLLDDDPGTSREPPAAPAAPEIKVVTPVVDATPNATLAKLETILESHADKANAYLLAKGHITAEQNFRDMPEALAAKVIANPKAFLEAINKRP